MVLDTRSSDNWGKSSKRSDPLNVTFLYPSTNRYGIPDMDRSDAVPGSLVSFVDLKHARAARSAIHFFADDYRFERVWNRPYWYLPAFRAVGTILTPDFSVFTDWPQALNIWQTYRNRWLGRFWQDAGLQVIPSVSWSTPDSLDYAFLGIAPGSVVAVQTQCVPKKDTRVHEGFRVGFAELLRVVEPPLVLMYGDPLRVPGLPAAPIKSYSTRMTERRAAFRGK